MRLGFNLLLWATHVREEHWPILEKLKATGYDGVEVPIFEGDAAHYRRLGRKLADIGLAASGCSVMVNGSCISADKTQRTEALDCLKWMIENTAAVGGDVIVGPFFHPLGQFSGRGPTRDEVKYCAEVHKHAAQFAATMGVTLAVEPLNRFECYFLNTAAQAVELSRLVDEKNYGYLFDTFHTNIEENSVFDVIKDTIRDIRHVHISENNRSAPGSGHIAFAPIIAALKTAGYDGWMTIEAFGSALPDLAAATKIWRPLFERPEDVYERGYHVMRDGWDRS